MRVIQVNLQKQTRNFFQNEGGGGARRAGSGSAFDHDSLQLDLST